MFNLKNKITGEWLVEYTGRYVTNPSQAKALKLSDEELARWNRAHGPHWDPVKVAAKKPS